MNGWDNPNLALLVKLGALVIHAEEFLETGEQIDLTDFQVGMRDPEVAAWIEQGVEAALLPVKRSRRD